MQHTQVLIVGAGPTGLTLAAQLHRLGVAFRIIDKHADVLELTKSAALHARTLEHFRDLGVIDRILDEGHRVDVLQLRTGYRDRVTVDFRDLDDVAYPYMIDIPQARTEHILIDHLTAAGVSIERPVTCTGLERTADTVIATVTTPDGDTTTIAADWVVGADGVHSTIRSLLGIEFIGADYADDWVLCDAVVDWPLPRNEMTFSGDKEGIYGVFPLPGDRRYRLAYTQNRGPDGELLEPDLADAQRAMVRTGIEGTIQSVDQFWTFNLAHKHASHYRSGRVFLAGDAGHVHTPFGGQGLNLGVGDAMNLGWKLAAVIAGHSPAELLDSYETERHKVAQRVVTFTHLGARAMLLRGDPRRHLRDAAFTVLNATAMARAKMALRFSQLGHTYRGTPLARGHNGQLHAGDRIPDSPLFDGVADRTVRLHDLVPADRFTILLTSPYDATPALDQVRDHVSTLCETHPGTLAGFLLTTSWHAARTADREMPVVLDRGRNAETLYGRGPVVYVVRPDRHIGYAGPPDAARLDSYLASVITTSSTTRDRTTFTAAAKGRKR